MFRRKEIEELQMKTSSLETLIYRRTGILCKGTCYRIPLEKALSALLEHLGLEIEYHPGPQSRIVEKSKDVDK